VILRETSDQIAKQNGWRFHVDGIHLNRQGGLMLADVVQQFLDTPNTPRSGDVTQADAARDAVSPPTRLRGGAG
jgi:hypothetical protein